MTYYIGLAGAILVFTLIIELLRRGRLRERHAFWWLLAGSLGLLAAIFPQSISWVSELLGIELPLNLVLFSSIVVLFLVGLQHSAEIARLEDKTRILAEEISLLKNNCD